MLRYTRKLRGRSRRLTVMACGGACKLDEKHRNSLVTTGPLYKRKGLHTTLWDNETEEKKMSLHMPYGLRRLRGGWGGGGVLRIQWLC